MVRYTSIIEKLKESALSVAVSYTHLAKLKDADWNLLLVGKEYPLDEGFKVKRETVEEKFQLDYRVTESAKKMLEAARAEELNPVITSAYLDNEQQKKLFNTQMELETESGLSYLDAYEATLKSVALPGAGEHATGLALDIVSGDYQDVYKRQDYVCIQNLCKRLEIMVDAKKLPQITEQKKTAEIVK